MRIAQDLLLHTAMSDNVTWLIMAYLPSGIISNKGQWDWEQFWHQVCDNGIYYHFLQI